MVNRQPDDERRAAAFTPALRADAAAVQLHQVADDAESEAETGLAARRRIGLAEPFEDVRQEGRRDADAGIGDRQHQIAALARQSNGDLARRLAELHGIPRQVPHDLLEPPRIAEHEAGLGEHRLDLESCVPPPQAGRRRAPGRRPRRAAPARGRCAAGWRRCARRRADLRSAGAAPGRCARSPRERAAPAREAAVPTAASAPSRAPPSAACAARARRARGNRLSPGWPPRPRAGPPASLATSSARWFAMTLNARPSARTSDGPASGSGRSKRPVCSVRADSASRLTGSEIHCAAISDRMTPTTTNHALRVSSSARMRCAGATVSS